MTTQTELFAPAQRHSATSLAAARQIEPHLGRLQAMVLEYVKAQGSRGATDLEMQEALGLDGSTLRPRRRELQKAGAIYRTIETRPTKSGMQASVWKA